MASSRIEPILQHLRKSMLRRDEAGLTDGQLLERFLSDGDAVAFEALVRRHGRMVLGVCRRVVGDPHDADDCFQATFLVLVRKAASIVPRERVGNWLYGVAHTTAVRVKAAKTKRQRRERQVPKMPEPEEIPEDLSDDMQALLDEELARLPEKYRTPIVLCDLEGRLRKEVARQLKIPEGTLSSRLTTGRRMLAQRLTRRGLAVSAGSLATILMQQVASASVPASLTTSTVKAALLLAAGKTINSAVVSLTVAALTEGVLKTMLLTKLKWATTATLFTVLFVGGAGLVYQGQGAESTPASEAGPASEAESRVQCVPRQSRGTRRARFTARSCGQVLQSQRRMLPPWPRPPQYDCLPSDPLALASCPKANEFPDDPRARRRRVQNERDWASANDSC